MPYRITFCPGCKQDVPTDQLLATSSYCAPCRAAKAKEWRANRRTAGKLKADQARWYLARVKRRQTEINAAKIEENGQ